MPCLSLGAHQYGEALGRTSLENLCLSLFPQRPLTVWSQEPPSLLCGMGTPFKNTVVGVSLTLRETMGKKGGNVIVDTSRII